MWTINFYKHDIHTHTIQTKNSISYAICSFLSSMIQQLHFEWKFLLIELVKMRLNDCWTYNIFFFLFFSQLILFFIFNVCTGRTCVIIMANGEKKPLQYWIQYQILRNNYRNCMNTMVNHFKCSFPHFGNGTVSCEKRGKNILDGSRCIHLILQLLFMCCMTFLLLIDINYMIL